MAPFTLSHSLTLSLSHKIRNEPIIEATRVQTLRTYMQKTRVVPRYRLNERTKRMNNFTMEADLEVILGPTDENDQEERVM